MRKIFIAALLGIVVACGMPRPQVPPPWRDDYVREPGWAEPEKRPLRGIATWFDATKNNAWYTRANKWGKAVKLYAAAGPALRNVIPNKWMMKPVPIWVKSFLTGKRVRVWVVDWCGCYGRLKDPTDTRLVDLAPAVWDALGVPLGRGIMKVEISLAP